MKLNLITVIVAATAAAAAPAQQEQGPLTISGSLFASTSGDGVILGRVARHKGDILTIVVNEAVNGSAGSTTASSKQDSTNVSMAIPLLSQLLGSGGIFGNAQKGGTTNATSSTAGAGTTTTQTSFTTNIQVEVKDELPNGNLLVEGKRTFKMNKQTQTILLEGTVRRDDVYSNNTVLSSQVSDLRLIADGKGLIADRQREGLLTKMLSWLF
jgi:flagellar L-ring protein FlgH